MEAYVGFVVFAVFVDVADGWAGGKVVGSGERTRGIDSIPCIGCVLHSSLVSDGIVIAGGDTFVAG